MCRDVAKRVLAVILVFCIIGTSPETAFLAQAAESTSDGAGNSHTYKNGSEEKNEYPSFGTEGKIAHVYTVKDTGEGMNAQKISAVSFALDAKNGTAGNTTSCVLTADFTAEIYTGKNETEAIANANGAASAAGSVNGKYAFDDCKDGYCTVNFAEKGIVLGDGEAFAVVISLENATIKKGDSTEEKNASISYMTAGKPENGASYVANGADGALTQLSDSSVCIEAETTDVQTEISLESLEIENDSEPMLIGAKKTFKVNYTPQSTSQKEIKWSVNNTDLADVNETSGEVTAKAAGTVTLTATSVENETIKATTTIKICKDISLAEISYFDAQTYTGEEIKPTFEVTYENEKGEKETVPLGEYSVDYENNKEAGTADIIITGLGASYAGEKRETFEIAPRDLSDNGVTAECTASYPFPSDGTEVKIENPETDLTVTYTNDKGKKNTLKCGTDFEISGYGNNTTAGNDAYAILTGIEKGNYTGETKCYFKITKEITSEDISVEVFPRARIYNGKVQKPSTITVKDGNKTLKENTDYTISYKDKDGKTDTDGTPDLISAGKKLVVVTGKGAYEAYEETNPDGTPNTNKPLIKTAEYQITEVDISSNNDIEMEELPQQVKGFTEDTIQGLSISYQNMELEKDRDYEVTVENSDTEKATVTITGKGNYKGDIIVKDVRTGIDIKNDTYYFYLTGDTTYTGSAVKPKINCNVDLKETEDYTVEYFNNVQAYTNTIFSGNSTDSTVDFETNAPYVRIRGIGKYAGELKINFNISQKILDEDDEKLKFDYPKVVPYEKQVDSSKGIEIPIKITYNNITLVKDTDYTIEYEDNEAVSKEDKKATVKITGKGNYTGDVTLNYQIAPKSVEEKEEDIRCEMAKNWTYTGEKCEPEVTVTQNGIKLVQGMDFELEYQNNINAGEACVIVKGKGNFNGRRPIKFTIKQANLGDVTIAPIEDKEYTGSEIIPKFESASTSNGTTPIDDTTPTDDTVKVTYKNKELLENRDFTVESCENNIEAGTAKVTLKGKGNFAGTKETEFLIYKDFGKDCAISFEKIEDQTYTGEEVTPIPVVIDKLESVPNQTYTLQKDNDFTLTYDKNKQAGTASVTITGNGKQYRGTKTLYFQISGSSLEDEDEENVKVVLEGAETVDNKAAFPFTGSKHEPNVTVTYKGVILEQGDDKDYTVEYYGGTHVAEESYVVIKGTGNFSGSIRKDYDITQREITEKTEDFEITIEPFMEYKKDGCKASVTIKDKKRAAGDGTDGYELKKDIHYTLSYQNYLNVSKDGKRASVTVEGIGDYSGGFTREYDITPTELTADDLEVTLTPIEYTYTGQKISLTGTVKYKKNLLTPTDYQFVTDAINVGNSYTFKIVGKGNYKGEVASTDITPSLTFSIKAKEIDAADVFIEAIPNQGYTGSAVEPLVKLTYLGKELTKDTDYTLGYDKNVGMDSDDTAEDQKPTITITGKDNFTGTRTVHFHIRESIEGNNVTISGIKEKYTYTSRPIEPMAMVECNGKILEPNTDYTIQYQNNIDADATRNNEKATATIIGTGTYGGTVTKTFSIEQADMETAPEHMFEYEIGDAVFTGSAVIPTVKITYYPDYPKKDYSYTLKQYVSEQEKGDYKVGGSGNTDAKDKTDTNAPSINIYPTSASNTQNGNFKTSTIIGSTPQPINKKFTIKPKDIGNTNEIRVEEIPAMHYDEKEQIPVPVLYDMNRNAKGEYAPNSLAGNQYKLKANIDFSIERIGGQDYINPGTAKIRIKGKDNYADSEREISYQIKGTFSQATVEVSDVTYTGEPVTPTVKVMFHDKELTFDKDYTYEFSPNRTNCADDTYVIVTGKGSYAGDGDSATIRKEFKITPKNIEDKDIRVLGILDSYSFTGKEIEIEPELIYGTRVLQKGEDFDYTFTHEPAVNVGEVGTVTMTATENGNYTGTITKEYKIGSNFDVNVSVEKDSYIYTGDYIEPAVTVVDKANGKTLTLGEDYGVEYRNNRECGTATADVYGIGNGYAGNASTSFTIEPKSLKDEDITIDDISNNDYTYTGKELTPTPAVTWNDIKLKEGEDFTYIYKNATNAGDEAKVIVKEIPNGNFKDSKEKTFRINKVDIRENAEIRVDEIEEQIYTGTQIKPTPAVYWKDKKLVLDEDYKLEYGENTEIGKGTVTINGTKNFTGTIPLTFEIRKISLADKDINGNYIVKCSYEKNFKYIGKQICPKVTLTYKKGSQTITLTENDFEVSYPENGNVNAGELAGTITLTGKGNYEGERTEHFTIEKRDLADSAISTIPQEIPNQILDAETQTAEPKPEVVLKPDSKDNYVYKLTEDDYKLTYRYEGGKAQAGTNKNYVVIKAQEDSQNFEGEIERQFYIGEDLTQYIADVRFKDEEAVKSLEYNGKAQEPEVEIVWKEGVDEGKFKDKYEIVYDTDSKNAGEHTVRVTGLEPYGGEKTLSYTVAKRPLEKVDFTLENQTFTGSPIRPSIAGNDKEIGETLEEGEVFTADITNNNTEVGTVNVALTAAEDTNYTGTATTSFKIEAQHLTGDGMTSSAVENQQYTGAEIQPQVTVQDERRNKAGTAFEAGKDTEYYTLQPNVDYTVSYNNNKYAGNAEVILTGKGHYQGTIRKPFTIQADLSYAVIAPIPEMKYTGGAIRPKLSVTMGDRTLKENFDYVVNYQNNVEEGTATATISPAVGTLYTGSKSANFAIKKVHTITETSLKAVLAGTSFSYTGNPITPETSVFFVENGAERKLTEGADYTVSYQNNVNAGTATVTITGRGAYQGTLTRNFVITKRSIIRCRFDNIVEKLYDGRPTAQNPVVTDGNRVLLENADYTISYVNHVKPGMATITITGIGNYGGIKTARYMIQVKDMTKVSAKASSDKIKLSWKKVDGATGYAIYNSSNRLIAKTKSTSYTHKKLKSMKTYTYRVRPYVTSDGATYYGGLSGKVSATVTPKKPSVKVKAGKKQVKVSWKKIKGVSGYVVYQSTSKSGKYTKIKTLKKDSSIQYTKKKLKAKKKYYYKVRAYKTVKGKKIYGSYSSVKSTKTK